MLQCWEAVVIALETYLNFSGFAQHPEWGGGRGMSGGGGAGVVVVGMGGLL